MKTARMLALVGVALAGIAPVRGAGEFGDADQEQPARHVFLTGKARLAVSDAIDGAIRRLSTDRCRLVLNDFADRDGRPLRASLEASGSAAAAISRLYFVDGDDTIQCRDNENVAAFTEPGSRVVHICAARFSQFARKPARGEILIIHEFLHTLGLAENPPTSAHITNVVLDRCAEMTTR